MQRYFMRLAYAGAPFHGWQRQPQGPTVQQCLEESLAMLLRHPVAVTGAGRTDTGVNARVMVAHFDVDTPLATADTVRRLNAILPHDIAIHDIYPVAPEMHARFSATERTYRYWITTRPNPFARAFTWYTPRPLDIDAMNSAAERLLTVSDFTSFAKLHSNTKTNICDVRRARWHRHDETTWYFEIAADRFLRNMVRAVVGTLVEVGRGRLSVEGFADIIARRDRCAAGTSMPPHPLFLWDVSYPT